MHIDECRRESRRYAQLEPTADVVLFTVERAHKLFVVFIMNACESELLQHAVCLESTH